MSEHVSSLGCSGGTDRRKAGRSRAPIFFFVGVNTHEKRPSSTAGSGRPMPGGLCTACDPAQGAYNCAQLSDAALLSPEGTVWSIAFESRVPPPASEPPRRRDGDNGSA